MPKKIARVLVLFIGCFVAGYLVIQTHSTDTSINRDPAAIGKVYDFSNLRGESLNTAVKQRLLAGFEIQKNQDEQGLSLGHFVYIDASGEKKFACQEFSKVVLTFVADGVAVAGHSTQMEVEGNCEFTNDVTKINPLWIPVTKILNEKVADGEFQFNGQSNVTLRFTNMPDEWPRTWLLQSVELKSRNAKESMIVESSDINQLLGRPMVLKF